MKLSASLIYSAFAYTGYERERGQSSRMDKIRGKGDGRGKECWREGGDDPVRKGEGVE